MDDAAAGKDEVAAAAAAASEQVGSWRLVGSGQVSGPAAKVAAAGARWVAQGPGHSLVVTSGGGLLSCGDNADGQLGPGPPTAARWLFEPVPSLPGPVTSAAAGGAHTLAATEEGTGLAWGSNHLGQLGHQQERQEVAAGLAVALPLGQRVVQVAAGTAHSLFLTEGHLVFACGDNSAGQLGRGHRRPCQGPELVRGLAGLPLSLVAAGGRHCLVVTCSGALFAWGSNQRGQLGCGDLADRALPAECATLRSLRVRSVDCGDAHSAAVTADGGLFTFGAGHCGQLGHGVSSDELLPRKVAELMGRRVTRVACGSDRTFAVADSKLFGFGQAVGNDAPSSSTPTPMGGDWGHPLLLAAGGDQLLSLSSSCDSERPPKPTTPATLDSGDMDAARLLRAAASAGAFCCSFLLPEHRADWHSLDLDAAAESLESTVGRLGAVKSRQLAANVEQMLKQLLAAGERLFPGTECLRLLLLLPLLPQFQSPCRLQPLSAQLLLRLPTEQTAVVASWLTALQLRHFARTVRCFVGAANAILRRQPATHQQQLASLSELQLCLRALEIINSANAGRQQPLPASNFHLDDIDSKVPLDQDYRRYVVAEGRSGFSFLNFPFVFNSAAKMQLIKVDARVQMEQAFREAMMFNLFQGFTLGTVFDVRSPFLVLEVDRRCLIADAVAFLSSCHPAELKKPLKICFKGEEAVDEGGLTKEFFLLIFRQILDPQYGMFSSFESNLLWFNSSTLESADSFGLVGILLGLAIYNSILAAVPFPLAMFKKLLKQPVTLEDFKELQPTVGRILQELLDTESADDIEALDLTFEIDTKEFDELRRVPLSDSPQQRVTLDNRESYVEAYVDHMLNSSCQNVFEAFHAGFNKACGSFVLKLLEPGELQAIVSGESEYFDWYAMEQHAAYANRSPENEEVIANFWSVFHHELSEEEKRRFLRFLTGSDRVPVQGMSALQVRIQIVQSRPDCLPVAHTCYNLLDLPRYPDRQTLRQKLLLAISETEGFSLV